LIIEKRGFSSVIQIKKAVGREGTEQF